MSSIITLKKFLCDKYPNLKDIIISFEKCSKDDNTGQYLVSSQVLTINFDKLTEWMERGEGIKSADSMSCTENRIYLIEFKSGDPTTATRKFQKLTDNVIGKINDSDDTLHEIYTGAGIEDIDQVFCLVIDSKKIGINPLINALVERSLINNNNIYQKQMLAQLQPNLKAGVHNPNHYSKIEIWYSEIFDTYLQARGIDNFCIT